MLGIKLNHVDKDMLLCCLWCWSKNLLVCKAYCETFSETDAWKLVFWWNDNKHILLSRRQQAHAMLLNDTCLRVNIKGRRLETILGKFDGNAGLEALALVAAITLTLKWLTLKWWFPRLRQTVLCNSCRNPVLNNFIFLSFSYDNWVANVIRYFCFNLDLISMSLPSQNCSIAKSFDTRETHPGFSGICRSRDTYSL